MTTKNIIKCYSKAAARTLAAAFFLFNHLSLRGQQNFVPNNSFEYDTVCPGNSMWGYSILSAPPWQMVNGGTVDWYNACLNNSHINTVPCNIAGCCEPRTGSAYCGEAMYANSPFTREYAEVKLFDSLVAGRFYCVTFYVKRSSVMGYGIDNIGAYLSSTPIPQINTPSDLIYSPQVKNTPGNYIMDTLNWTIISGVFHAVGGEKYITIGNFDSDGNTHLQYSSSGTPASYYFIDDVSIVEANQPINAGRDTVICPNNPVLLGSSSIDGVSYSWSPSSGLSDPYLAQPVASPDITTTYILTQTQCNVVKVDTVTVTIRTRGCLVASVPVVSTEAFSVPTILCPGQTFTIQNLPPLTRVDVYDLQGKLVYSKENYDNTLIADQIPAGIYFTRLTPSSGVPAIHKLFILR